MALKRNTLYLYCSYVMIGEYRYFCIIGNDIENDIENMRCIMGGKQPEYRNQHLCVGLLAHVDAGKTTLAESILYETGKLRKAGRVDHGDAFLDTYALEKARGITIFSKQALNRLAREGGDDVARLGGAARGKVLAGRHDAEKVGILCKIKRSTKWTLFYV